MIEFIKRLLGLTPIEQTPQYKVLIEGVRNGVLNTYRIAGTYPLAQASKEFSKVAKSFTEIRFYEFKQVEV